MESKIYTPAEAMADIQDGAHIAAHIWGLAGTPLYLLRALIERGVKDLTLYCSTFLPTSLKLTEMGFSSPVDLLPQLQKLVSPFVGSRAFGNFGGDFLDQRVRNGELEIEATTHGVLASRLHAGATSLGGFYSPIGTGTIIERGKEKRIIDGQEYLLEKPIRPDVGLIKADRADRLGNLVYRGTGRGINPLIAMASRLTIVEVFEIVEVGELDPETVITPGIYVDRIVKIPEADINSKKQRRETVRRLFKENQNSEGKN